MKKIEKSEFTKDRFLVIDEKTKTVMEILTGETFIASISPEDTTVTLFTPQEWFDLEEEMLQGIKTENKTPQTLFFNP